MTSTARPEPAITAASAVPPTIAAVIVNYNYARFLPDAVESVLGQEVPFNELVVVDDGSTDESVEVLELYRDRVRVLRIPNGGQLGACRAGLAAVGTDYVYFLDADDRAGPALVATLRGHLAGAPVKVQFPLEGESAGAGELESVFPTFPPGYDAARMRADNRSVGFYICPPTSGNVYLRRTLLDLPLDTLDQRDFIDGPATLALPYVGEIRSLDTPLAVYRVHGGNHSQWSEPTVALLEHETEWFTRRWRATVDLVGMSAPPFGGRDPLYVLERQLMIAALRGRVWTLPLVWRTLVALRSTHQVGRQKAMLAVWALGLAVPVPRLRSSLVRARRSPVNRSGALRRLVRLVIRGRRRP
ncbi:MAG: glycosyltransferase family 2 protein [Pseudonocardia sp.]